VLAEHNLQLHPWVTVHTGSATVATEGTSMSLVGEARTVATRLKDIADSGQIVLSESTHRMLRSKFSCLSLGHHKVKGLDRPIELFHLQGAIEAEDDLEDSGRIGLTPLTGRDLELTLLKDRLGAGTRESRTGCPARWRSRIREVASCACDEDHVQSQRPAAKGNPGMPDRCRLHQ